MPGPGLEALIPCLGVIVPLSVIAACLMAGYFREGWPKVRKGSIIIGTGACLWLISYTVVLVFFFPSSLGSCLPLTIPLTVILAIIAVLFERYSHRKPHEQAGFMTKNMVLVAGLFVLGAVLLMAAALFVVPPNGEGYQYWIEVNPSGNGSYQLYLPVPVDSDGNVTGFAARPKVNEGNGAASIVDTEYGKALEVSGSGPIKVKFAYERKYHFFEIFKPSDISLSLLNSSSERISSDSYGSGDYRVWLNPHGNCTNLTVKFELNSHDATIGHGRNSSGHKIARISEGWNIVPLEIKTWKGGFI